MTNAASYDAWISEHRLQSIVPRPTSDGVFDCGGTLAILPFLQGFWSLSNPVAEKPPWQGNTWDQVKGHLTSGDRPDEIIGYIRFFRADQILDWLLFSAGNKLDRITRVIPNLLRNRWLIPVREYELVDHLPVFNRRLETVRLGLTKRGTLTWDRGSKRLPDQVRRVVHPGLDLVHTPENARAGLTHYICLGWTINDTGKLEGENGSSLWGSATVGIPYKLHDVPRRLMLAASLHSRAVPLVDPDPPSDASGRQAQGRKLLAAFSTHQGWNHEDAIVLSHSAATKLRHCVTDRIAVRIPAVAIVRDEDILCQIGEEIEAGMPLLRAKVDLFALGFRLVEAEELDTYDGWKEINLPHAVAPFRAKLIDWRREKLNSSRWGERIVFRLQKSEAIKIGDKLSTLHGIKGVVSRILPDDQMPLTSDGKLAEIVLSPPGIAKRGAMGQFFEAGIFQSAIKQAKQKCPGGTIFVLRQPQDAEPRCLMRGTRTRLARGQRYGEMEFWALMAHGAEFIAAELLSHARSTAAWLDAEQRLGATTHQEASTQALNRYLAAVGGRVENGQLILNQRPKPLLTTREAQDVVLDALSTAYSAQIHALIHRTDIKEDETEKLKQSLEARTRACLDRKLVVRPIKGSTNERIGDNWIRTLEWMESVEWFIKRKGLVAIRFPSPLLLEFYDPGARRYQWLEFHALPLLPPWLRPTIDGQVHPLTKAYRSLFKALARYWPTKNVIRGVVLSVDRAKRVISLQTGRKKDGSVKTRSVNYDQETKFIRYGGNGTQKEKLTFQDLTKEKHVAVTLKKKAGNEIATRVTLVDGENLPSYPPWTQLAVIREKLRQCIRLTIEGSEDDHVGANTFLRREVLGRRLTRSARAVIVPDPTLRIDQIRIPKHVADVIFEDLAPESRQLVLVNRNPTLHRRGLIALRPVIEESPDYRVFGLPLGILANLGADFDGDQVSIIALETAPAFAEAQQLLPGWIDEASSAIHHAPFRQLRQDPFRPGKLAFPLQKELNPLENESSLANATSRVHQGEWCKLYKQRLDQKIAAVDANHGWEEPVTQKGLDDHRKYLDQSINEKDWVTDPEHHRQMHIVADSVRKKSQYGAVFRRELYRRTFVDQTSLWHSVEAVGAVTERLVQTALTVKHGEGAKPFQKYWFFQPLGQTHYVHEEKTQELKRLDETLDAARVLNALGMSSAPPTLMAWMASPRLNTLLRTLSGAPISSNAEPIHDPRITWFLCGSTSMPKTEKVGDRLLERLRKAVSAFCPAACPSREEIIGGVRWLVGSMYYESKQSASSGKADVPHLVYYRSSGQLTVEDVTRLMEEYRLANVRPILVLAAEDGIEPKALSGIERSHSLDYFDGRHAPEGWPAVTD